MNAGPSLINRLAVFLLTSAFCTTAIFAQRGAIVRPQNLSELTDEAAVIVRGRVISAEMEAHAQYPNLKVLAVTLRVDETLKGQANGTYTFRQFVWDVRDRMGATGYRKGQHVLLFLIRPSSLGLSSPAGLEQGRFRIERDAQGRELALNAHGNAGLLRDVAAGAARRGIRLTPQQEQLATTHRSGPLALDDLRGLVRQLARSD